MGKKLRRGGYDVIRSKADYEDKMKKHRRTEATLEEMRSNHCKKNGKNGSEEVPVPNETEDVLTAIENLDCDESIKAADAKSFANFEYLKRYVHCNEKKMMRLREKYRKIDPHFNSLIESYNKEAKQS